MALTKETKIAVFSFNTTSGKQVTAKNKTIGEIIIKLQKTFPNWSNAAIEKIAYNPQYHKQATPISKEELVVAMGKKRSNRAFVTPIIIDGVEVNAQLRSAKALKEELEEEKMKELLYNNDLTRYFRDFKITWDRLQKSISKKDECEMSQNYENFIEKFLVLKTILKTHNIKTKWA